MNIKNALHALSVNKRTAAPQPLDTPWSDRVSPENAWQEYPRPQMKRDSYIPLNGLWDYTITERRTRLAQGRILVPFSPEAPLSGVGRQLLPGQTLHYRRRFHLPECPAGKRLLLHFGAVDERCRVFVNGQEAGRHRGGYLSFSFDITRLIHSGENTLRVSCRDDSDQSFHSRGKQMLRRGGIFYTAQSGIWQSVWMEWVPETYIESLRLTPDYDRETLHVRVSVCPDGRLLDGSRIEARVSSKGRTIAELSTASTDFSLVIHNFTPWTPDNPFLYDLELRLISSVKEAGRQTDVLFVEETACQTDVLFTKETALQNQEMGASSVCDYVTSYFAMRCFSVERDAQGIARLCLNHTPFFQNGVLDQGYWPDGLYTAPCDEAMVYDIQTMKDAGFNMLRKHCKLEPLRWYYHCDRLGMLVWQDMVNGGSAYDMMRVCYLPTVFPAYGARPGKRHSASGRKSLEGRAEWLCEMRHTIEHLYNCPCIASWVLFNEGWGQFDTGRVTALARSLDPTRTIDQASGWFDCQGGDMRSVHNYFRALTCPQINSQSRESDEYSRPRADGPAAPGSGPETAGTSARPYASANRCGLRAAVISEYGGLPLPLPGHTASQAVFGYRSLRSPAELRARFAALQKQIRALCKAGLSAAVYTQVSDIEDEVNGILTYDRRVNKLLQD